MPAEVISGVVVSGQGGASEAMTGERLRERSEVAGAQLVPGTLNVRVGDLRGAVAALNEPVAVTDTDNERLGPLRWWPVTLTFGGLLEDALSWSKVPAWVVRHERTGTRYLEVVSSTHFRKRGVEDGDVVRIIP